MKIEKLVHVTSGKNICDIIKDEDRQTKLSNIHIDRQMDRQTDRQINVLRDRSEQRDILSLIKYIILTCI